MKTKLFSKNSTDRKLPLPQEIIDQIQCVSRDQAIREIDEKILRFQELLKEKRLQLSQTTTHSTDFGSAVKSDPVKDGLALVDGCDIESLAGSHPEDRRRDIIRQIHALEKALAILENNRRHRLKHAIFEACKALPEEVLQVFRDVIDSAEELKTAIEKAIRVDEILNKKGIENMRRDARLTVIQYWRTLLYTGPASGIPSMSFILENQRKIWENENEK